MIGLVCLVLAVILFFLIPWSNMLSGFPLSLFALGTLERDSFAVFVEWPGSIVRAVLVAGVLSGLVTPVFFITQNAVGLCSKFWRRH
jgi:hypothetical protein